MEARKPADAKANTIRYDITHIEAPVIMLEGARHTLALEFVGSRCDLATLRPEPKKHSP